MAKKLATAAILGLMALGQDSMAQVPVQSKPQSPKDAKMELELQRKVDLKFKKGIKYLLRVGNSPKAITDFNGMDQRIVLKYGGQDGYFSMNITLSKNLDPAHRNMDYDAAARGTLVIGTTFRNYLQNYGVKSSGKLVRLTNIMYGSGH
jgi:hypothetical protein